MSFDTKVAIAICYKPTEELIKTLESHRFLLPVNAGSTLHTDEWMSKHAKFDDTGDNISKKNPWYNELTVEYWMWKNMDEIGNPAYVGLNHYRRMFPLDKAEEWGEADITVAEPITFPGKTLVQQYAGFHNLADLKLCAETIGEVHGPGEGRFFWTYLDSMVSNFAPRNMFVMKRELFDRWCNFVFPVLFSLEQKIGLDNLDKRDNYQRRALGFMAERMFGYWCFGKRLECTVKTVPAIENLDYKPPKVNERGDWKR